MKTASGCCSTNGCTPKNPAGFDPTAKTEAGWPRPTAPHSNDEDVRKSLRLNIWPLPLQGLQSRIFRFCSLELYCWHDRQGNRARAPGASYSDPEAVLDVQMSRE